MRVDVQANNFFIKLDKSNLLFGTTGIATLCKRIYIVREAN